MTQYTITAKGTVDSDLSPEEVERAVSDALNDLAEANGAILDEVKVEASE